MVWEKQRSVKTGENATWEIKAAGTDPSLYYSTDRVVIVSHNRKSLFKMLDVRSGSAKGIPKTIWGKDKTKWPAHIEICDGGLVNCG